MDEAKEIQDKRERIKELFTSMKLAFNRRRNTVKMLCFDYNAGIENIKSRASVNRGMKKLIDRFKNEIESGDWPDAFVIQLPEGDLASALDAVHTLHSSDDELQLINQSLSWRSASLGVLFQLFRPLFAVNGRKKKSAYYSIRILEWFGSLIPRKHREAITGDISEDISFYRKKGKSEFWLVRHVVWQLAIVIAIRIKDFVGLGVLAWITSRIKGWFSN